MKIYWTDTRPNGTPIEPGTVCLVSDPEDDTHPIYTYGANEQEVLQKVAHNNLHAQAALQRRIQAPPPPSTTPRVEAHASMSAGELMQAMAERDNPATAGAATARLVTDATGVDFARIAMDNFKRLAEEWETDTPAFYPHPGNRTLVARAAGAVVNGKVGLITKELLDECFTALRAQGQLFEVPESSIPPNNLETFPDETQVRRTERPRGVRFATRLPGSRLGAPQSAQPKTLKYTKEQIDRIPVTRSRQLIMANDPDYAEACEFFYPTPTKQASA